MDISDHLFSESLRLVVASELTSPCYHGGWYCSKTADRWTRIL